MAGQALTLAHKDMSAGAVRVCSQPDSEANEAPWLIRQRDRGIRFWKKPNPPVTLRLTSSQENFRAYWRRPRMPNYLCSRGPVSKGGMISGFQLYVRSCSLDVSITFGGSTTHPVSNPPPPTDARSITCDPTAPPELLRVVGSLLTHFVVAASRDADEAGSGEDVPARGGSTGAATDAHAAAAAATTAGEQWR